MKHNHIQMLNYVRSRESDIPSVWQKDFISSLHSVDKANYWLSKKQAATLQKIALELEGHEHGVWGQ